jgi:RNA-directed DNA polymerase
MIASLDRHAVSVDVSSTCRNWGRNVHPRMAAFSIQPPLSSYHHHIHSRVFTRKAEMPSFSSTLPSINSETDLASFLKLSEFELKRFCLRAANFYSVFERKKKSGNKTRTICAPTTELKRVQRLIKKQILDKVELHSACTGYRKGMSIVSNAEIHVGQRFVLNLDIKNFFPSISTARVAGLFVSLGFSEEISLVLAKLCCFQNAVPQGSPASPSIANLICHKLDRRLNGLAQAKGFKYSRYCDDVTISGDKHLGEGFIKLIEQIVSSEGFEVNKEKTRLFTRKSCQTVTGLTVNEKVSIPRARRRLIRAILHQSAKKPLMTLNCKNYVNGLAAYMNMVRRSRKV